MSTYISRNIYQRIYLGISLLYLLVLLLNDSWTVFIKPLMMPLLIAFYLSSTPLRDKFLLRALICCWLGDLFLMQVMGTQVDFLLGMLAFMAGHVLYIICFRRLIWSGTMHSRPMLTVLSMLIASGLSLWVFSMVFPSAGELQMPVLVYMIIIVSMLYHAVRRRDRTTKASYQSMVLGAACFLISDAVLAVNKFYAPVPFQGILVMSTYLGAQYLIVQGVVLHTAEQPARDFVHA